MTSSQNLSVTTKEKKKLNEPGLARKRKREDGIEDDIKQLSMIMGTDQKRKRTKIILDEDSECLNNVIEIEADEEELAKSKPTQCVINSSRKKARRTGRVVNFELNEADVDECKAVDEILEKLNTNHAEKSPAEILDTLQKTSFDIENTYLVLNDPLLFKG